MQCLNFPAPKHAISTKAVFSRRSSPVGAHLQPKKDTLYFGFGDMSGGSSDDATLAIAHREESRTIIDAVISQDGGVPINPRTAVRKFVRVLLSYGCCYVTGDDYAGSTFKHDFQSDGIPYRSCKLTTSELYENMEPVINAGEIELPDLPKLTEQLLILVIRGSRVTHLRGDHDDWATSVAGVHYVASKASTQKIPVFTPELTYGGGTTGAYVRNFGNIDRTPAIPDFGGSTLAPHVARGPGYS
jgi:hypothetical protein